MIVQPVIVAIPARNEESRIGACLAALAAQPMAHKQIAGVVVYANNCTDATVAAALACETPFPLQVIAADLPPPCAHIGTARRGATEAAMALMRAIGLDDAIIAGTDADSMAAPGWLAALQAAFAGNVDAVCGVIALEAPVSPSLHAALLAEAAHAEASARVAAMFDPLAHDPWPNHLWCWGANLAVRAGALAAVGGTPAVALAEDRALHALLLRRDIRIRHSLALSVTTSGRPSGRAPGGFADLMASYANDPDALADHYLEPAALTWARTRQRGMARRRWGAWQGFGAWWAEQEANDPALARGRVAISDLPEQTRLLNRWLGAAKGRSDKIVRVAAPSERRLAAAPR